MQPVGQGLLRHYLKLTPQMVSFSAVSPAVSSPSPRHRDTETTPGDTRVSPSKKFPIRSALHR